MFDKFKDQRLVAGMDATMTPGLNSTGMISPASVVTGDEQIVERLLLRGLEKSETYNPGAIAKEIHDLYDRECCVLIVKGTTTHLGQLSLLSIIGMTRHLMGSVWETYHGELIKCDELKFFVIFKDLYNCYRAGQTVCLLGDMMSSIIPDDATIQFQCGAEFGSLLVIPGELYGNPVNLASKLGEDIGEPGEFLMSRTSFDLLLESIDVDQFREQGALWEEGQQTVSGVALSYLKLSLTSDAILRGFTQRLNLRKRTSLMNRQSESTILAEHLLNPSLATEEHTQKLLKRYRHFGTFLCTDLSGFTRLTKAHGIIHYLQLIAKQRIVMRDIFRQYDGKLLKYNGDDIIGIFSNPLNAVLAGYDATQQLAEYNLFREEKDRVEVKTAIGTGMYLQCGNDVIGEPYYFATTLADSVLKKGDMVLCSSTYEAISKYGGLPPEVVLLPHQVVLDDQETSCFRLQSPQGQVLNRRMSNLLQKVHASGDRDKAKSQGTRPSADKAAQGPVR